MPSSGSVPWISSIEPLMSANSTVTCLRSPSSAPRLRRILSGKWLGPCGRSRAQPR